MPLLARVRLLSLPVRTSLENQTLRRRRALRMVEVVLFAYFGCLLPQSIGAQDLQPVVEPSNATQIASPAPASNIDKAILAGSELEKERRWSEAIRHYEKAYKKNPGSRALYQRLITSRLHNDINRRYKDRSFVSAAESMSAQQALDLYSEILNNLDAHYFESMDWSRVLLHGTASLEIALTEPEFIQNALPRTDRDAIHQFEQTIHRRIANRPASHPVDLRATVAFVANTASKEIGISPTAVVFEYIGGAMSTLDAYTRLLSGDQLDEMFSNIQGNFVGLGVELKTESDALRILSVIPNGPAEKAGVKPGERIVRVEDSRTDEVSPEVVADMLRGPEHTIVSVFVRDRQGNTRRLMIPRRRVEVPCVENVHIVDPASRIGYLRLTNFQKTTNREVERALMDLRHQGMQGLILDVRGNPGGLLSAAVEVADRFISQGRIVTTRGRNVRENFDYIAHRTNTWDIPLAVLIDRDSASASEIFAGAILDSRRGILVGEKSYGKGSVQGIFRMQTAKFGLCLTTARFYSPSGKAISDNGVLPDLAMTSRLIAARPTDDGHLTLDTEDEVLQKAIGALRTRNGVASLRN